MPRWERPADATRSEFWLRKAVNEYSEELDGLVCKTFEWDMGERIEWLSPVASDKYAEYSDDDFLERLGVTISDLPVPLNEFWPPGGPHWDGLARTRTHPHKLIFVEAKAYIEEGVPDISDAGEIPLKKIKLAYAGVWLSPPFPSQIIPESVDTPARTF